jgi:hypothetical protein
MNALPKKRSCSKDPPSIFHPCSGKIIYRNITVRNSGAARMDDQPRIFVSYAHADTKWLNELDPHLRGLEIHAKVERFDDRQLLGGDDWDVEVKAALDRADIVLLLITANFIGSEYIHRVELPTALRKRADKGCIVIPVLLESCYRKLLQIEDINYVPKDSKGALKPVSEWRGPQRARCLTQIVEHVCLQIDRRLASVARDSEAASISGIDVSLYRRRAQAKWSAIDLSALAAPGAVDADITIRLADIFVPQLARRSRPAVSLPRDYLEKQGLNPAAEAERAEQIAATWERSAPVSALELVAECRQRHLILLGDPGAGKSALARFVLLRLLDDVTVIGAPLATLAGHMPFLIELRDFVAREAEGRCADLLSYLGYCGGELGFGFDQAALEHHLNERASLLIIDGLDEIFDPRRRRLIVEQIIGLVARHSKLRLFITSRVAGFDDHPFRAAEFSIATLIDLTSDQVGTFAKAWFTIVFQGDPDGASRARDDLLDTLERRPQLGAIAGNPMILTIMATVARHKRLGRSRAGLYEQALGLLCYNWDYKRGLELPPDSPLIDLQAEDTLLMLRSIAWRMQEAADGLRANAIDEASLRRVVEGFLELDWHFDPSRARRAAREMLERLQVRNWVLTLRGPELYGFVHRTFLEYLCALELSERFKAQVLDVGTLIENYVTPRLDDDAWHEVLRLLLGLLPPNAAEQVLLSILPGAISASSAESQLAFGWQCLAEVEPRHVPTLRRACGRLTELLYAWFANGPSSYASYHIRQAVSDAINGIGRIGWPAPHPPSIPWPRLAAWCLGDAYTYHHLIGLLGRTVWNCPLETNEFLRTCAVENVAESSRAAALRVLGEQFSANPETKILLRTRATGDRDTAPRAIALHILGSQFGEDSETRILLRARALEDLGADVRSAALAGLAQCSSNDPEAKIFLQTRALEDPDADARAAALAGLAQWFSGDPETKRFLEARASEDPGARVRTAALYALAANFEDDNSVKALLCTRALNDPDADTRASAIWALAESFGDDGIKPLLRARAVGDSDANVRGAALEALTWFSDDLETKILLRARALDDPEVRGRCHALRALAQMTRGDAENKALLRARAHDDPNVEIRREALGLLITLFSSEDETKTLLRERALNDPWALDADGLDALARYFGDDQTVKALCLMRARSDTDDECRAAAFLALCRSVSGEQASILASRDLDGQLPGRDPREPVGADLIAKVAARLDETVDAVRTRYERLAEEVQVPLTFA